MPRNPTRRGQVRHGRGERTAIPPAVVPPVARRSRSLHAAMARAVEHLEDRLLLSVARDANGFDVPTPSADSRVYYVSAAGNDNNNGTSPATPFATIAKARTLVRNGFPDYILLRRGDAFNTPITGWAVSGRSADEPMVIGAYTDPSRPSDDRPRITTGTSTGFANQATTSNHPLVSHLYLMGIAFEADARNYRQPPTGIVNTSFRSDAVGGTYGVNILGPMNDFLVEDCSFQYFRTGLALQSVSGWGNPTNVRLRRSQVLDSYAPNFDSGGASVTSEGIYADGVQGLTLDENVFDHNGWMDPAYSVYGCNATIFNHDAYLNINNNNVVVTGNVFANASSHGLQARAGGIVDNNLFVADPIGMSYGYVNGENKPGGVFGEIIGNVAYSSRDIAGSLRGWALELSNLKPISAGGGTVVKNNIYSTFPSNGQPAIQVTVGNNTINPTAEAGVNDLTFQNNIVYNWTQGFLTNGQLVDGINARNGLNNLTVANNDFVRTGQTPVAWHSNPFSGASETWRNNRYDSIKADNASTPYFRLNGQNINLPTWQAQVEPTAADVRPPYPDPTRSPATYNASLGGASTLDDFVANARQQSSTFWRSQYQTSAVLAYMNAGFAGQKIDALAPTVNVPAAPLMVGGSPIYTFTATFTDDNQLDSTTINSGDFLVTGPGNYSQPATLVSVTYNTDKSVATATYSAPAPNGTAWDASANGTYGIAVQPGAVLDTSGKSVPAGLVAGLQVSIDPAAPLARLTGTTNLGAANAPETLTVTYSTGPGSGVSYSTGVRADAPAGYWRLDDAPGATFMADASGNGRPGTYFGNVALGAAGALSGDSNTAASFDGSSGYAEVPYTPALNNGAFSVEAWVNPTGGAGTIRSVITSRDVIGGGVSGYAMYAGADDQWHFFLGDGSATGHQLNGPGVTLNQWTHLVATYDGTTAQLYVNGQLFTSQLQPYVPNAARPLRVGAGSTEGSPLAFFPGRIDEAAVYAAALGPSRVQSHYATGTSGPTAAGISVATLDSSDLLVTGPSGFSTTATLTSIDAPADGSPRTATYVINPPAGGWGGASNGTYTVSSQAGQVATTVGVMIAAGALGTFKVAFIPPSALGSAPDVTTVTSASRTITVSYTDDTGINSSTIDANDLRVLGPNGFNAPVTFAGGAGAGTTASPLVATYTLPAPTGGWTGALNGTYYLVAQPSQVTDLNGNPLPTGAVGAFRVNIDIVPPLAVGSSGNVTTPSTATKTVTVTYMDPSGINPATLATGDITVTGPGGFNVTPTFQSSSTNGATTTATYTFTPPNGIWQSSNNGAYTITLQAGAVADNAGNGVPRQTVGTFSVALETIPPAVTGVTLVSQASGPPAIRFTFSENVVNAIDPTDLVVQQLPNGTPMQAASVVYDTNANTATFQVTGGLPDGDYTATLASAGVNDPSGNHLDGDGDGLAGGDSIFSFSQLAGVSGTPGSTYALTGPPDNKLLAVTGGTVTLNANLSAIYPVVSLDVSGGATVVFAVDQSFQTVNLSGGGNITDSASAGQPSSGGTSLTTGQPTPTPTPTPTSAPTPTPTPTPAPAGSPTPTPTPTPLVLAATRDGYVRDGAYAGTDFSPDPALMVKKGTPGNTREAYLTFDLSQLGTIHSARLRLFGKLSQPAARGLQIRAYTAGGTWSSGNLKWKNRPGTGATASRAVTVAGVQGQWYEWDVTSLLRLQAAAGRASVTFAMKGIAVTTAAAVFDAGRGTANGPQLVVT